MRVVHEWVSFFLFHEPLFEIVHHINFSENLKTRSEHEIQIMSLSSHTESKGCVLFTGNHTRKELPAKGKRQQNIRACVLWKEIICRLWITYGGI